MNDKTENTRKNFGKFNIYIHSNQATDDEMNQTPNGLDYLE